MSRLLAPALGLALLLAGCDQAHPAPSPMPAAAGLITVERTAVGRLSVGHIVVDGQEVIQGKLLCLFDGPPAPPLTLDCESQW